MKHIAILLTSLILLNLSAISQTTEDSVRTAVARLFTAMKNADADMIRTSFADSAILQSIAQARDGKVTIENEKPADFAIVVSKLPKDAADERIVIDAIKIDGPLAMVWAPYSFYYNGKFSHCGVDSFQLVRINGEWKIQYLVDTRRRQACN
jgi:hypothetical protein